MQGHQHFRPHSWLHGLQEQSLKRAILHRKASMFHKTVTGAEVGDIYINRIP